MGKRKNDQYTPDYAVPPGDTLLEVIESIGMSQTELAERTNRPKKTISGIINGKISITPETALQFERALGIPAKFWMNLENNYQETLVRLEEQARLEEQQIWLKKIPIKDLLTKGWIEKKDNLIEQFQEVLNFFGVSSVEGWDEYWGKLIASANFRQSKTFRSDPWSVASWLRKGEKEAQNIECEEFNATKFKQVLTEIRRLTTEPPEIFIPAMTNMAASAGVAIVFIPEISKCRINGATRWLNPDKALIQLSLRYKTNDHLWFTFFHEAGHILKHGKKNIFLECGSDEEKLEYEADLFASDFLIPPKEYLSFKQKGEFNQSSIRVLATQLSIAPGIVVGRLQHDKVFPSSHYNDLKVHYRWATKD